ncbi:hypothetical protein V1477_014669 [Vespula maculifrons]|uniref:Transmembrane protein n=1 Tax=Vespula maculifrons TaxID=7453 RepID=A0ABD2BI56_VESMC
MKRGSRIELSQGISITRKHNNNKRFLFSLGEVDTLARKQTIFAPLRDISLVSRIKRKYIETYHHLFNDGHISQTQTIDQCYHRDVVLRRRSSFRVTLNYAEILRHIFPTAAAVVVAAAIAVVVAVAGTIPEGINESNKSDANFTINKVPLTLMFTIKVNFSKSFNFINQLIYSIKVIVSANVTSKDQSLSFEKSGRYFRVLLSFVISHEVNEGEREELILSSGSDLKDSSGMESRRRRGKE